MLAMHPNFRRLCLWFSIILGVSSQFLYDSNAVEPKFVDGSISCVVEIAKNFFVRRENVLIISTGSTLVAGKIVRLMEPDFAINLATKHSKIDFSAISDYIVLADGNMTDAYDAVANMSLNPRGRYVIETRNEPEDIEMSAEKFWNAGIPNVIFVKPLNDGNVTVFGSEISSRPHRANATLELRVLDHWEGKFIERNNLFPNKFTNMNKYPLKVSVRIDKPWRLDLAETRQHGEPKLIGVGSKVLNEFAKKINFSVVIFSTHSTMVDEVVARILQREADLTFVSIDHYYPVAKALDYSVPYRMEPQIFAMGFPNRTASWNSAIKTFSTRLWACLFLALLAALCLAVGVQKLWTMNVVKEYIRPIDVLKVYFGQSVVYPKHSGLRFAFAIWMLYALLMTTSFTGGLLKLLSTPSFQRDPRTIEELSNSELKINKYDEMKALLAESSDPVLRRLSERFGTRILNPFEESWEFFTTKAVIVMSATYVAFFNWEKRHNESVQFRIIEGGLFNLHYSYFMWKGHPYREPLNRFIGHVQSTGLINKWLSDEHALPVNKRLGDGSDAVVLTLKHLASVFLVFACGCVASISTFFYELYCAR